MLESLLTIIRESSPAIALFLSVALGHLIGKIKIGPVQLGGVCGTLLVAICVGQFDIVLQPGVKNFFFAIFIFALGYAGGPQFFANLNGKGLRLGVLSLIEVVTVLGIIFLVIKIFHFDPGTAAGIVAGSATESAVIGTASEAIARLPVSPERVKALQGNIATAYSITYLFGLITIVVFSSQIAPLLLRVSLREEAEKLWTKLGGGKDAEGAGQVDFTPEMTGEFFEAGPGAGRSVAELEHLLEDTARVEKVIRNGAALEVAPESRLEAGDQVLVAGHRKNVLRAADVIGPEITAPESQNLVMVRESYVLHNRSITGRPLSELSEEAKRSGLIKSAYLSSITRNGQALPLLPDLRLAPGDVVGLYGKQQAVTTFGARVGRRVSQLDRTNFIYLGAGVVLGILIGSLGVHANGIFLTLGTGGGALLSGLVFGWFQNRHPDVPGIPPSALEMCKDVGLTIFVACVGLSAGPQSLSLIKQYGVILPVIGVCMVLTPALISLVVGRKLLGLEVPVLLGGIAGQQCSTPAVSAVQAAAGNSTPVLGYTISYAISNVMLPLLGPVVVGMASILGS